MEWGQGKKTTAFLNRDTWAVNTNKTNVINVTKVGKTKL